jgi:hypothetical protein
MRERMVAASRRKSANAYIDPLRSLSHRSSMSAFALLPATDVRVSTLRFRVAAKLGSIRRSR